MNYELILVGLVVGVLVGLTGVGGGSIMTPLLVLAGINPLIAVGSDLAISVPMKLLGAGVHYKQRTVDFRLVKGLALGGIPAAVVGIALLFWLRAHVDIAIITAWTTHAIGCALFLSAVILFVRPLLDRLIKERAAKGAALTGRQHGLTVATGAVVGFIVTITSIGSGAVTLPLLSFILPTVGLDALVGSDIAFAAVLLPTAALGRFSMGDVDLGLTFNVLLGALPGVYVGSRLCALVRAAWLRPAVALTLAFVGTRLI